MSYKKVYCAMCDGVTNLEVLREYTCHYDQSDDPDMGIDCADGTWQIIRCKGCERVSFREHWHTSDDYDFDGPTIGTEYLYPKTGPGLLEPKHILEIPPRINQIYNEIIDCFNSKNLTACAALIRVIIEAISDEAGRKFNIDGLIPNSKRKRPKNVGQIQWKIELLGEAGILSKSNSEILQETRFLGNKALHELKRISQKNLKSLIWIVEHTLENVFELPEKVSMLQFKRKRNNNNSSTF